VQGGFCFGRFGFLRSSFALVGNKSKLLFTRLSELLALFLHLFYICSVAMPASRPYKHQKSTKNKTQNRLELIYRTTLNGVLKLLLEVSVEQSLEALAVTSLIL
jgi:hypothetical protein